MKNAKGLLALAVATAIILVGCGGEPAQPKSDVQPKEDVTKEIPDEVVSYDERLNFTHDNFIVHSNNVLYYEYNPSYGYYEERFEHVKTRDDAAAVENAIRVIQSSLISEISNALTKNPHEVSDSTHINELRTDSTSEYTPTRELVTYNHLTSLLIIDKFDDDYMNEHHAIEGVTDFMVQLEAYEENLENAESPEEIVVTLFENDQFVVILSPSPLSLNALNTTLGSESTFEYDNAQALSRLDEYVGYFKTPKVKSIIEDALGQKF